MSRYHNRYMKAITYLLQNTYMYISMLFLCTLISEMLFYYFRFVEILITHFNRQHKYKCLNNKYNTVVFKTCRMYYNILYDNPSHFGYM